MPSQSSEILTIGLRTQFRTFHFLYFLHRFFVLVFFFLFAWQFFKSKCYRYWCLNPSEDCIPKGLDIQSSPSTVPKWPRSHLHVSISAFPAWEVQEAGHVSLASRLKCTWEKENQICLCCTTVVWWESCYQMTPRYQQQVKMNKGTGFSFNIFLRKKRWQNP